VSLVPFDKIRDRGGQLTRLQIAATAQFAGDVLGNIFRPALGGIEGDDVDRVTIFGRSTGLELPFRGRWFRNLLGLRHIATWYGVTVGRLQTWETQLRDGGQLAAIMKEFGLPHASALQWSNGGQVSAWRNLDMAKRIAALRFQQFMSALRAA
jgi:hypothetical protein